MRAFLTGGSRASDVARGAILFGICEDPPGIANTLVRNPAPRRVRRDSFLAAEANRSTRFGCTDGRAAVAGFIHKNVQT